jgi:hypothetical protein
MADIPTGLSLNRPHERKGKMNQSRRREGVEVDGGLFNDAVGISDSLYTRENQQTGHKWIQNVKHVIFEPGKKNIYFST